MVTILLRNTSLSEIEFKRQSTIFQIQSFCEFHLQILSWRIKRYIHEYALIREAEHFYAYR